TMLVTVTDCVAVALPPAESITVSFSVCEALDSLIVSSAYEAVVPLTVCVEVTVPSTASWNVFDTAVEPLTDIPTVVVPVTVAPEAGLVKAAVSTGVGGVTMAVFTWAFPGEPAEVRVGT